MHSRSRAKPGIIYSKTSFGMRLRGDLLAQPIRWAHTIPNSLWTYWHGTLPRQSLCEHGTHKGRSCQTDGMKSLAIVSTSKPAARDWWGLVGGNAGGAPTVTFGATSLKEGGQGQGQRRDQNQTHGSVLDLALDLPLPPSLREGAAVGSRVGVPPHPVAHHSPRDLSFWFYP
jgi:hypothetical protein